jgi:hypothetical protein
MNGGQWIQTRHFFQCQRNQPQLIVLPTSVDYLPVVIPVVTMGLLPLYRVPQRGLSPRRVNHLALSLHCLQIHSQVAPKKVTQSLVIVPQILQPPSRVKGWRGFDGTAIDNPRVHLICTQCNIQPGWGYTGFWVD